jgi:hypothetical protein
LLRDTLNLAVKMRSIGSVLQARNISLRASNRVEEDLLEAVVVACSADSGSIAGALALGFEEVTIDRVQTEFESGALIKCPTGDTVGSRADRKPGV